MDIDEDDISVTSTIEDVDGGEEDYEVREILVEADIDGETKYLIEWEGYPVHQATWEPREHLGDYVFSQWQDSIETRRQSQQSGRNLRKWKDAMSEHLLAKNERHKARNRKRAQLGLAETIYDFEPKDVIESIEAITEIDYGYVAPQSKLSSHATPGEILTEETSRTSNAAISRRSSLVDTDNSAKQPGSSASQQTVSACMPPLRPQQTMPSEKPSSVKTVARKTKGNVNVFAGGKTRKSRVLLQDAAADPTRGQKLLKRRFQNILRSRSTSKDGTVAPSTIPKQFIVLDKSMTVVNDTDVGIPNPIDNDSNQPNLVALPAQDSDGAIEIDDLDDPLASPRLPKSTNSMVSRENGHAADKHTPLKRKRSVHLEDELDSRPQEKDSTPCTPDTSSPSNVLLVNEKCLKTNISKDATFGLNSEVKITLTFDSTLRHHDLPWLLDLRQQAELQFLHTCSADAFMLKIIKTERSAIVSRHLTGLITSPESEYIKAIAANLQRQFLGVFCHCGKSAVLLLPTLCDAWISALINAGIEVFNTEPLQYLIFEPDDSLPQSMFMPTTTPVRQSTQGSLGLLDKDLYEKLVNHLPKQQSMHSFFLAFPKSAVVEEHTISHWLRQLNPGCELRTSAIAGSWNSFLEEKSGVIIFHEDVSAMMHKFPNLFKALQSTSSAFSFWLFERPLRQFIGSQIIDAENETLPTLSFRKIFPFGMAMLLTPSFILSRPIQTYSFLKWFFKNYSLQSGSGRRGKLVVAADIDDWVFDLAMEKTTNIPQFRDTEQWHRSRLKTWELLRELRSESELEEFTAPLVFAPQAIAADDEQSLLNWFGWWSTTQIDSIRKFTAICSDDGALDRFTRLVAPPEYYTPPRNAPNTKPQPTETGKPHIARDDSPQEVTIALRDIVDSCERIERCPVLIYDTPISRKDNEELFQNYLSWFTLFRDKFLNEALLSSQRMKKNTYVGFFFTPNTITPAEGSDDAIKRNPWLGIYRPQNPHLQNQQWKAMELFIWDLKVSQNIRSKGKLQLADLSEEQQELVRVVKVRSNRLPLSHVWIGGFDVADIPYIHPVDITFDWLKRVVSNLKYWLPAPQNVITQRGWRSVSLEAGPSAAPRITQAESPQLDLANEPSDLEVSINNKEKLIFHPPQIGRSPAKIVDNNLYQWAIHAKSWRKDKAAKYIYDPTLRWYTRQIESGQGLGHINVTDWRAMFEKMGIENPERGSR